MCHILLHYKNNIRLDETKFQIKIKNKTYIHCFISFDVCSLKKTGILVRLYIGTLVLDGRISDIIPKP